MHRLENAADQACDVANKAFEEAAQLLEKRRLSYISKIREVAKMKREKLVEQLELINKEREQVRETCEGLEYQVEVIFSLRSSECFFCHGCWGKVFNPDFLFHL